MTNPLALLPNAVSQRRPEILYGVVSATRPAPASFSDPLYVIFPQWQADYFFQVDDWPASHGQQLPSPGAEVVLVKDSTGAYRCLWWDGKHSPAMPAPFCNKLANHLLA